jgi:hypothetical protein
VEIVFREHIFYYESLTHITIDDASPCIREGFILESGG